MDIKRFKQLVIRFWRTEDTKISLVRDILVAFLLVLVLLLALWSYTGQWFGIPMVAIESGSMMHPDESGFGKLGTIDAGDMVFLIKIEGRDDIATRGGTHGGAYASRDQDNYFYGDYGDVIVYRKYGNPNTKQIIHRARCWVEKNPDGNYTVAEYGLVNVESITIEELGLNKYKPSHSGFITQGDNPYTNPTCDQVGGICDEPIKPEWISGKARSELPWIGTINLFFDDFRSGCFWGSGCEPTVYNVSEDCIFCLIMLIAFLISIPVALDIYDWYKGDDEEK